MPFLKYSTLFETRIPPPPTTTIHPWACCLEELLLLILAKGCFFFLVGMAGWKMGGMERLVD